LEWKQPFQQHQQLQAIQLVGQQRILPLGRAEWRGVLGKQWLASGGAKCSIRQFYHGDDPQIKPDGLVGARKRGFQTFKRAFFYLC